MSSEHYIEDSNLSFAWARALKFATASGHKETISTVVSVTGFNEKNDVEENRHIRSALDHVLETEGKQPIETVANTIFPNSLWNPTQPMTMLFDRYSNILPRLRKASHKNNHGLYFERMISGGPPGHENQLEFAIRTYCARPGVRRSVLQVAVFNPNCDHSAAAMRGFPCLQHLSFAPTADGLAINAFYATQYLTERAYGNYLGICRLGKFVAHEIGIPLKRMTCFIGIGECDVSKRKLAEVFAAAKQEMKSGDKED